MLRAVLEEAARRLPGCEAAVLVGRDGMVVEKWASRGAPRADELAAEMTPVLKAVQVLGRNTGGGGFSELSLTLDSWSCLMMPVNDETYIVLIARPGSLPGRIRYEASRAASRLEAELR
jgi:predicted regulator of Ras-like GTPase activity (Roadblock/LC7/MglB family)